MFAMIPGLPDAPWNPCKRHQTDESVWLCHSIWVHWCNWYSSTVASFVQPSACSNVPGSRNFCPQDTNDRRKERHVSRHGSRTLRTLNFFNIFFPYPATPILCTFSPITSFCKTKSNRNHAPLPPELQPCWSVKGLSAGPWSWRDSVLETERECKADIM